MHVKTHELKELKKDELLLKLKDLKQELLQLKVQKQTQGNQPKFSLISTTRKSVAKVLTVLNQQTREHTRLFYKKKLPYDLRQKKTRAIRRQLTKEQLNKKTLKQHKKQIHFGPKKFAIRA
jgi:large subunit ribosomal protein L35e